MSRRRPRARYYEIPGGRIYVEVYSAMRRVLNSSESLDVERGSGGGLLFRLWNVFASTLHMTAAGGARTRSNRKTSDDPSMINV